MKTPAVTFEQDTGQAAKPNFLDDGWISRSGDHFSFLLAIQNFKLVPKKDQPCICSKSFEKRHHNHLIPSPVWHGKTASPSTSPFFAAPYTSKIFFFMTSGKKTFDETSFSSGDVLKVSGR